MYLSPFPFPFPFLSPFPFPKVKVVGHEAVAQDAHGDAVAGVGDQIEEGVVVAILAEDSGAGVAAVKDVVTHVADGGSCGAWHGGKW